MDASGAVKNSVIENENADKRRKERYIGAAFLVGVTGASLLFGFSTTVVMAKKKDPNFFNKGLVGSRGIPESGGALALRALGWGTLYAVGGVGLLSWGIWKLLGVHSMEEFRMKMGNTLPNMPKPESSGRNEFGSVRELVDYLVEDGGKDASKKS